MKKLNPLLILILLLVAPIFAHAWGQNGHRIVGEIASNHLSKRAKKQIQKILGSETPAFASTWADFVKSDHQYDFMYNWHFVNMPSGWTENQVHQFLDTATQANVYNKSLALIAELKNKNTENQQKIVALKMLIHMLGDLSQPMHVGHAEDLGGNKINVLWFNKPTNLHALWDDGLLSSENLSYTEYTHKIDLASASEIAEIQSGNLKNWVFDAYQIASKLYEETQPEQKLSYRYIYDHLALLDRQLLKGGLRLAKVLNEIYN